VGYSGIIQKKLAKPKAERIIKYFRGIYVSNVLVEKQSYSNIIGFEEKHMEIVELLNLSVEVFTTFGKIQETGI
jgi:hypothetical protein